MTDQILTHEKQMSMSLTDFHRSLPAALTRTGMVRNKVMNKTAEPEERVIVLTTAQDGAGKKIKITLTPINNVRLGALNIPQISARFSFDGFNGDEKAAFLNGFDTAFQRGGG